MRKVEDKIKQIIDRIKENEIHQRDKYQTAKLSMSAINENVNIIFFSKNTKIRFFRSTICLSTIFSICKKNYFWPKFRF